MKLLPSEPTSQYLMRITTILGTFLYWCARTKIGTLPTLSRNTNPIQTGLKTAHRWAVGSAGL